MRTVFWLFCGLLTSFVPNLAAAPEPKIAPKPAIAWQANFESAQLRAQQTGKPILVYFHADWCGPCHAMENKVFPEVKVIRASRAWVPVKIDLEAEPELAARFEIENPPTIIFLQPDGTVFQTSVGYNDAPGLGKVLEEALSLFAKKFP